MVLYTKHKNHFVSHWLNTQHILFELPFYKGRRKRNWKTLELLVNRVQHILEAISSKLIRKPNRKWQINDIQNVHANVEFLLFFSVRWWFVCMCVFRWFVCFLLTAYNFSSLCHCVCPCRWRNALWFLYSCSVILHR